jgi:tetratricopeptide (TPR) repeat protein
MDPEAPKDFFISYTHADQGWAEWIAWQLEAEGYTTRIQTWDFLAGSNFVHEMDKAAKQATRTIAVLSPDYFTSHFTSSEWEAAFARDPRGDQGLLVPVRVRPCDVEGLLKQVVYIDLVDLNEEKARATLLRGVKHERRKPSSSPVFPSTRHSSQAPAHPSFPGALPAVWNIPFPRNPYFTGREEVLRSLAASLRTGETVGISQPQAVSGLGGVGKTQLALEYAYRYYQDYEAVLWTRADTQEALISGFVTFAAMLQLPMLEEDDQLKVVQAVKHWLVSNTCWLLLLDNADDLTLVRDFQLPAGKGHTLLTTRAASMGRLAHALEVDALNNEPGALFLLRRTERLASDAQLEQAEASDRAIALAISQELGGLPLALDQAGAFIEETKCSLADYLQLYRTQRSELLKARGGLVSDHPEPVATTWSLSFANVQKRSAIAADLLRVCAFMHPDAIPEEIIIEGATALGPNLQVVAQNPLAFNQAIGVLLSYSLLKRQPEEHLLSMHRLVQAVIQDELDEETQRRWAERVVQAVSQVFPFDEPAPWPKSQRYQAQALVCEALIKRWNLILTEAIAVLYNAGSYLEARVQYEEAEPMLREALAIGEKRYEVDHSDTSDLLQALAKIYSKQGKEEEAEPLMQRALAIREKTLGPEHFRTAQTLNALAVINSKQGKGEKAEALYQRALAIREKTLGPEHPETADTLNTLAVLYTRQKRYEEAEPLLQRALASRERTPGPEHPDTAHTLYNLADLYLNQGKYEQAESLFQRALAIYEKTFGPEHPHTSDTLNSLARLYHAQGKYEQAELLYQRSLRIREQQVKSNPNDAAAYLDRGYAYLFLKKSEEACADFAKYTALRPKDVNAAWMAVYAALGKERPGGEIAERLEVIAELDPQSDGACVCRGVALELRGKLQEGLAELEHALSLYAGNEDAWFWKGVVCACLGRDATAKESIKQALKVGLPPILLTPLYWLEQDSPNFYQAYAEPLLKRYGLI